MNKLIVIGLALIGSVAGAQDRTPTSNDPRSNSYVDTNPAVTVCDMRVKTLKKAKTLCSAYGLDAGRSEDSALFGCVCDVFGSPGPRGQ